VQDRATFCRRIAPLQLSHVERAVALLWFYAQTQQFEERTAAELADDLHEEKFPRPRVDRLNSELTASRQTIRGRRAKSFQIDIRRIADLDSTYGGLLGVVEADVDGLVLPVDWFKGTRLYLDKMAHQINGCYEYGFYDGCAVLCRRLMESLIVETYIKAGLHQEIKTGAGFRMLDGLISHIRQHKTIVLSRNAPKTMEAVKQLGDTAAHDRTYITQARDIDDTRAAFRRLIQEPMYLAGISKTAPAGA